MSETSGLPVFISISDSSSSGEFSQRRWAECIQQIRQHVGLASRQTFGEWYSAPDAGSRSACFYAEIFGHMADGLRRQLAIAGAGLGLDAVTWTDGSNQECLDDMYAAAHK